MTTARTARRAVRSMSGLLECLGKPPQRCLALRRHASGSRTIGPGYEGEERASHSSMLTRKTLLTLATATMLLGLAPASLRAQDTGVRIIVHAGNPVSSVAREELSRIFLKKVAAWKNGDPVIPVDQVEATHVRKLFSELLLRRDVRSVKGYWQQAIFTGKSFPPL